MTHITLFSYAPDSGMFSSDSDVTRTVFTVVPAAAQLPGAECSEEASGDRGVWAYVVQEDSPTATRAFQGGSQCTDCLLSKQPAQ
jgi:hypothetical protein